MLNVSQVESRIATDPAQPLDETKDYRRFIILNNKDKRPVFNCIEVVSLKTHINYPDFEMKKDGRLWTMDSIARTGQIYTLYKNLEGIVELGYLTDPDYRRRIKIGLNHHLPFL